MLKKPKLTILTDIIPSFGERMLLGMRNSARRFHRYSKENLQQGIPHYGGHFAVTRSLVEGLVKIGVDFNYNPCTLRHLGTTVVVLSSLEALKQAIEWKREGRVTKLLAGPNLVVLPSDNRELITAPEIDAYMVNSVWTYNAYTEDAPELQRNCVIWSAGVDTSYWKPAFDVSPEHVLIYQKNASPCLLTTLERKLTARKAIVTVIKYGSYKPNEFLNRLQQSIFAVFLSQFESQGIALAEAWSVNVPTLVWDPAKANCKGKVLDSSSAPYLSDQTGIFFQDEDKLDEHLDLIEKLRTSFRPRQWVLNNMSDEICAFKFMQYIDTTSS